MKATLSLSLSHSSLSHAKGSEEPLTELPEPLTELPGLKRTPTDPCQGVRRASHGATRASHGATRIRNLAKANQYERFANE